MAERSCPRAPRGGGDGRGSARHGGSGGGREERGGMAGGRGVARLPPLPLTPLSPGSAVPGAGPPRGRADTPGLLECRRCRYLRTGRGERGPGEGGTAPSVLSRCSGRASARPLPVRGGNSPARFSLQPAASWWERCSPR